MMSSDLASVLIGRATWAVLALAALMGAALAAEGDKPGTADHPMVGRYDGAVIAFQIVKGYDEIALPNAAYPRTGTVDEKTVTQALAGKVTATLYRGPGERSSLEIVRNFEAALTDKGFTPVFGCKQKDCGAESKMWGLARGEVSLTSNWNTIVYTLMKLERPEGRVWVSVIAVELSPTSTRPLTPEYVVHVVEEKALETGKVLIVDSGAMQRSIETAGKVVLYGINFDTDSDKLRADSAPQIGEIAKLLKAQPKLSVLIVGHTDAKGTIAHNRDLSERRAASVVGALTGEHGIEKARLFAVGVGPAAPVATNRTEDGRAKNRRVEIVELPGE